MTQTVVITGASAGIGPATAVLYGQRGDRVGLLARGRAGLDAAATDVEHVGGTALAVPTDVAHYDQVKEAALRVEDVLGPIDVWVNVAFTSVFAPVLADRARGVRATMTAIGGAAVGAAAVLAGAFLARR